MANKITNYTKSNQPSVLNDSGIYEIKIKGLLDAHWGQWFEGMTLQRQENVEAGLDCTLIIGPIPDQPALHGLLAKIRDINVTLISIRKLDSKESFSHGEDQDDVHTEPSQKDTHE
jgi:hypothetical protein